MDNCHKVRVYYDFPILFDYLKDVKKENKIQSSSSFCHHRRRCHRKTNISHSKCRTKHEDKNIRHDHIDHSKKINSISFTRKIIDIHNDDEISSQSSTTSDYFVSQNIHSPHIMSIDNGRAYNLIVDQKNKRITSNSQNKARLLSTDGTKMLYLVNHSIDQTVVDKSTFFISKKLLNDDDEMMMMMMMKQQSYNKQIKSNVSRNKLTKIFRPRLFEQNKSDKYQTTTTTTNPQHCHRSIREFNDGIITNNNKNNTQMMENFDHTENFDTYLFSQLNIDENEYKMLPPTPAIENRTIGKNDLRKNVKNNSIIINNDNKEDDDDQIENGVKSTTTTTPTVNNISLIQSSSIIDNTLMNDDDDVDDNDDKKQNSIHQNQLIDDESIVLLNELLSKTFENNTFESSSSSSSLSITIPNWEELCERIYRFNGYRIITDIIYNPKLNDHQLDYYHYNDDWHTPSLQSLIDSSTCCSSLSTIGNNDNREFSKQQQQQQINFTTNIFVNQTFNNNNNAANKSMIEMNTTEEQILMKNFDIEKFIFDQSKRIFLLRENILAINNRMVVNLKEIIEQLMYDTNYLPITSQRMLLFDLCKEKIIELFPMDLNVNMNNDDQHTNDSPTLMIPLKMQKIIWPSDFNIFAQIVYDRIKRLILPNHDQSTSNNNDDDDGDETTNVIYTKQKRIGLMAFCRQQRKLDFVDRLLYHEMLNEQPQWLWSYFSPEMMKQIKNELCNTIMDDIINNCIYEQCIRIIS